MNAFVSGGSTLGVDPDDPSAGIINFTTVAGIKRPVDTFLLWDESPVTIDDGAAIDAPGTTTWENPPATYHLNANGMSFVDTHAIIKQWHDQAILNHNVVSDDTTPKDGGVDLRWVEASMTYTN
jgi:hypothetical protein